ncbi:hypothetical protein KQI22_01750 [Kineothrix sp. MSJ-39]|uniref:HAD family hydrolase n=1 Tax=Kineothrix sp. MSJ-39 TaxID=2841533 RepID=UPI001C0F7DD3|nr:hypothetical protein [Kineothrix sp. MSJ-39]MBU5428790.1 hypothetical protein [Kineothrix sp. MSJ-39]
MSKNRNILYRIKRQINTGVIDQTHILKMINQYSIISFDVFDTLLKRLVDSPTDVFRYIEQKYQIQSFAEKRINAEKKARDTWKTEVSLEQIYSFYSRESYLNKKLMEIELAVESEMLIVNEDIKSIYDYCIKQKKTILLISDMYLPVNVIEKILQREGICGYSKLYVSCGVMKTKLSGDLFRWVLDENNIAAKDMLHIGDSWKGDYKIPRKLGISVLHIPNRIKKTKASVREDDTIDCNMLKSFINNTLPWGEDEYYKFGYEKFGMFLWGYAKWIKSNLLSENIKKVYFFSRDGLIMKKAFDLLEHDNIESYYLEVSRRSLRIPILWMDCEFETILDMISPSQMLPIETIFDGVGLDIDEYDQLLFQYGFDKQTSFERKSIGKRNDLRALYDELKPDIIRKSKQEYVALEKYIKQNSLKGKFAIVDIGWSGGMQRYLTETLDRLEIDNEIKGYYIGVADYYKRNVAVIPQLSLKGYLFDFKNDLHAQDKRKGFVGLFETLFLEQNGSVKSYKMENGIVKACRYPYEYLENGKPSYEFECVMKIQKGALDFIKKIEKCQIFENTQYNAEDLFEYLNQVGNKPTLYDIKMFGKFRFYDEGQTQYLADPNNLIYYLFHLSELKREFMLSRWKIGYMKKMFRIPLPYEMLYKICLKIGKRGDNK